MVKPYRERKIVFAKGVHKPYFYKVKKVGKTFIEAVAIAAVDPKLRQSLMVEPEVVVAVDSAVAPVVVVVADFFQPRAVVADQLMEDCQ